MVKVYSTTILCNVSYNFHIMIIVIVFLNKHIDKSILFTTKNTCVHLCVWTRLNSWNRTPLKTLLIFTTNCCFVKIILLNLTKRSSKSYSDIWKWECLSYQEGISYILHIYEILVCLAKWEQMLESLKCFVPLGTLSS